MARHSLATTFAAFAFLISSALADDTSTDVTAEATSWRALGSFVALSVADAPAVSRWYQEKLGFKVLRQGHLSDRGIKFALLKNQENLLEIIQLPDTAPPAGDRAGIREAWQIHGFAKAGFIVADLAELERRLKAKGVRFSHGIVQPEGNPYRTFAIRDIEGNVIQFFGL